MTCGVRAAAAVAAAKAGVPTSDATGVRRIPPTSEPDFETTTQRISVNGPAVVSPPLPTFIIGAQGGRSAIALAADDASDACKATCARVKPMRTVDTLPK